MESCALLARVDKINTPGYPYYILSVMQNEDASSPFTRSEALRGMEDRRP